MLCWTLAGGIVTKLGEASECQNYVPLFTTSTDQFLYKTIIFKIFIIFLLTLVIFDLYCSESDNLKRSSVTKIEGALYS